MPNETVTERGPMEEFLEHRFMDISINGRHAIFAFAREQDSIRADLLSALLQAKEAFRLTREYVGVDALPALEGWSWFDAVQAIDAAIKKAKAS